MERDAAIVGDIGGTNIRLAVIDGNKITEKITIPTPAGADEFFEVIGENILQLAYNGSVDKKIALGVPGPVTSIKDGMAVGPLDNVKGLEKGTFDMCTKLQAVDDQLGAFEIYTLNDATAATYKASDILKEMGKPEDGTITYICIGTGVGGDSVTGNIVASQATGTLGEYGDIPIRQRDGSYVSFENLVSGPAIKDLYGYGKYSAEEMAEMPDANKAWYEVGQTVGQVMGTLVPIMGTNTFLVGGSLALAGNRYIGGLMDELRAAHAAMPEGKTDLPNVEFVPKGKIDTIGLYGAHQALRLLV